MENDYISALEKAVATLNSNVNELRLALHQMNIKVTELKGKVLTDNLKTGAAGSQFVDTKAFNAWQSSVNKQKRKGN